MEVFEESENGFFDLLFPLNVFIVTFKNTVYRFKCDFWICPFFLCFFGVSAYTISSTFKFPS